MEVLEILQQATKFKIIIVFLILLLVLEFFFLGGLELLFKLAQEVNAAGLNFIECINDLIGR